MNKVFTAVLLLMTAAIAGCGGGGSRSVSVTSATISGKVADGYLVGAEVFLDKNGNYHWDGGEPKTATDANGTYSMMVPAADAAMYPMVARAIAGVTVDRDTNTAVADSYVLSAPAGAAGFISPMSTLIREKMAANPNLTLTEAMTQLRNQMNLPAGIAMMADYVAGSQSGADAAQYQAMHTTARQMVGLMAGQSVLVMSGGSVNVNRYRSMMGTINANMPGITANARNDSGMNSPFMINMMTTMQSQLGAVPTTGGFMNYSAMFRNMTSHGSFWSNGGNPVTTMSGGMMDNRNNPAIVRESNDIQSINQPQAQAGSLPISGGFASYSGMFRNMAGYDGISTGNPMTPMSGGMMR